MLVYPNLLISLAGLGIVAAIVVFQYLSGKAGKAETGSSAEESTA